MLKLIRIKFRIIAFTFSDSLKTIFRDPGAILILLFASVAYPVVYSIAYSNDVIQEIPMVVIDNDQTASSRLWSQMLDATPQAEVVAKVEGMTQAEDYFWEGKAHGVLLIPKDFEKNLIKGEQATIGMYADASNFLFYKETFKSTMRTTSTMAAGVEFKKLLLKGNRPEQAISQIQPIKTRVYNLYNPEGSYGSFVMPGMIILILQQTMLIGIGLIGGAGRERKRDLNKTIGISLKNHPFVAIIGKSLAYFVIGTFNIIFTFVLVYNWFSFPSKGDFINIIILSIPFLFSVIFLGLAISLLFKHREHSIIFLVFLSPIVLFVSGLSWPVESIPKVLHGVFQIAPSTQMIPAYLRLRTMGVPLSDVSGEFSILLIQMVAYFLIAGFGFKYSMRKSTM